MCTSLPDRPTDRHRTLAEVPRRPAPAGHESRPKPRPNRTARLADDPEDDLDGGFFEGEELEVGPLIPGKVGHKKVGPRHGRFGGFRPLPSAAALKPGGKVELAID